MIIGEHLSHGKLIKVKRQYANQGGNYASHNHEYRTNRNRSGRVEELIYQINT